MLDRKPGASATAAAVLILAATYADPDGTNIRPGNERLAAQLGKSARVVERAVAELVELGELIRCNGPAHKGSVACYRLNFSARQSPSSTSAFESSKARRPRRQSPSSTSAHLTNQGRAARHGSPARPIVQPRWPSREVVGTEDDGRVLRLECGHRILLVRAIAYTEHNCHLCPPSNADELAAQG